MENLILQKRNMVQSRIEKSFESGLQISELQCIEKAHNVGDVHPNGKWVWTEIRPGKFDWRVKKNGDTNGSKKGSAPQPSGKQATTEFNRQQLQQSSKQSVSSKKYDADVTEHVDELVKKIGKDKALERFERYIKEYGDDGTKFGAMMKYKYSQAAEYLKGKAESDFKKTFKDARDEVLQQIVSGKIQASADEKKWAKDIIDERQAATKSTPKISNSTDHGNTKNNAYQAYKSGKITKEQYEGITGKKAVDNKIAQKPKSAAKTFADKIMERAKDGRWIGSLSDDEEKKLEDNIKNDKASINDLLLAKFPAATAYSGLPSSKEKTEIQLANGKMLKLVHIASIQSNRMGQEYTKHEYQITDLYGKVVYGSSQSSRGYTTPAQAKRETIDQALYALFAKK